MNARVGLGRRQQRPRDAVGLGQWGPAFAERCDVARMNARGAAHQQRLIAGRDADDRLERAHPLQRVKNGVHRRKKKRLWDIRREKLERHRGKRREPFETVRPLADNSLEADIDVELAFGHRHLLGKLVCRRRPGLVGRHVEHRRHAAERGRMRARREVFLVGQSRFAQMRVRIDETGQQHTAAGVDHLPCFGRVSWLDQGRDPAGVHGNVAAGFALRVDDRRAADEGFEHSAVQPARLPANVR